MSKKFTIKQLKERLKDINPNIEILSEEYINAKTKLKCKCLIDSYVWGISWNNLQQGKGCPMCSGNIKLDLETVKSRLAEINPDIQILSDKYINNQTPLTCKCKIDNNEWEVTWNKLQYGGGCPECFRRKRADMDRLSLKEVRARLKEINPNIEILSKKYTNAHSPLECMCKKDKYRWRATWSNLSKGAGCPECARVNKSGSNSVEWKGGITPIYNHLRNVSITQWKKDSMESCDYKCVITGKRFDVIHHLVNYNQILQETIDITGLEIHNEVREYTDAELKLLEDTCLHLHYKYGLGVCLTEDMHKEFHSTYGYTNNTKKQFEEFRQIKEKEIKAP